MMKTLSIVVRARRDSTHLNRCLQSLFEQNYPAELMEIVVVDRRGRLETKQLLHWWMCDGASRRSRPELRYLPVSAVSDESMFFEAARATSGSIIVVVDDLFEAPPRWALSGVAAASSAREPGAANASTDLNGKFLPRSEVLSAGTAGTTETAFQPPPLPQATATFVEQALRERSANYAREYVMLLLLVATVTCALLGQLRLAMAGLIGWSAISLWLALRLLHLNMRQHGGWKTVFGWRADREMAPPVRMSPSSATPKESLDARQR